MAFDKSQFPYARLFSSHPLLPLTSSPTTQAFHPFPPDFLASSPLSPSVSVPPSPLPHPPSLDTPLPSPSFTYDTNLVPLLPVPFASPKPSPVSLALAPIRSYHPMQTRAKSGIFKPRVLIAAPSPRHQEPSSVFEALSLPHWHRAMGLEYNALLRNNTWDLAPSHPMQTTVHNKWIFVPRSRPMPLSISIRPG